MLSVLRLVWPELLILGLLVLLAWPLPVRIAGAGEWLALEAARAALHAGQWLPTAGSEPLPGMPPLWPWLVALTQWAGQWLKADPVVIARLLSSAVSVITAAGLYLLAGNLFQQRWLACLAVILWLTLGSTVGMIGSATPLSLLTAWVTLTALIWPPQQAQRRRQTLLPQWAFTGVMLALSHVSFGLIGDLAVLVAVGNRRPQTRQEALALSLPWLVVSISWSVITGISQGWLAALHSLVLWQPLSVSWLGLGCNLLMVLVPWGLFLWPYSDKRHTVRDWLQGRLLPLTGLGLLCCGQYPVTALSLLSPFLALSLTQFLGQDASHPKILPKLRSRVDWSMSLLILLALGLTGWVFQYLPNSAFWPHWHLPGEPVLNAVTLMQKSITLDEGFPLWKLWLLPIPIGMVIIATLICLLSWWERFERSVFWLTGGVLLLVLLVRSLALPLLWPAYESYVAQTIRQLQLNLRVLRWQVPEPRLNPVKYYLPLAENFGRHTVSLASDGYYHTLPPQDVRLYQPLPDIINLPKLVLYTETNDTQPTP
jgi:hypothetical protein